MQSEKTSMSAPVHAVVHMPEWFVVVDTSQQDELGNGPVGIAISTCEDDPVDAVAWMQEGTEKDAELMAAAPALKAALMKFVAWHDMDHELMKGWEVQEAYDKAIDAAKSALRKVM